MFGADNIAYQKYDGASIYSHPSNTLPPQKNPKIIYSVIIGFELNQQVF